MKNIEKKKSFLIWIAPILCISMLVLVPLITSIIGKTAGYIVVFCIYWLVFCIPVSLYFSNGFSGVKGIYSQKSDLPSARKIIYYILAFVPCIGIFFVVFMVFAPKAGIFPVLIAAIFALINGTIEEMFWRGIFNKVFKENLYLAFLYPSLFFGIWHVALYNAKGISYQGGFASLVGGSLIMGLLWGWIAYKTKSIKVVTIAHIITNFLAFTGLIYQNWFS